jgi:hypothetical protein
VGLVTGVPGDRTSPDSRDDRHVSLVWLDSREAIIVRWDGSTLTIDQMESDVPARHRATGHERHHPDVRYGAGFGHPHSTGEARRLGHLARFVDHVASRLAVDDDLILIGPGAVHEQLARRIGELDARHAIHRSVQSESAPPMTRRQLAARVRRAAGHEPRRRTVGAYRWSSEASTPETAPDLPRRVSRKRPSHRALTAEESG